METTKEYLARLLPMLKKEIPSQWRVQSYSKNKAVATVMSYIDQRDLMDVLDAYCEYGWHKKYEQIANNVFCSIGIVMPDDSIQWKSDCGVESQSDAEKGRASDAAKRAGVNWGVGRFLYDKPIQYVTTNGIKGDLDKIDGTKNYKKYPFCIDEQLKQIWDLTKYLNDKIGGHIKAPEAVIKAVIKDLPAQAKKAIEEATTKEGLTAIWNANVSLQSLPLFTELIKKRRGELL
jgi:hypothetical protein